jgi:hypothetical protein
MPMKKILLLTLWCLPFIVFGQFSNVVIVQLKSPNDWGGFNTNKFTIDTIDSDWGLFQLQMPTNQANAIPEKESIKSQLDDFNAIHNIFSHIHTVHKVTKRAEPNDPFYASQPYYQHIGLNYVWNYQKNGVNLNGDTLVVAYIDDGVDTTHPDLQQNLWRNTKEIPNNGIDDDSNGYIDDYRGWNAGEKNGNVFSSTSVIDGHGTNIAGILGADGNNGIGCTGTNWNIKVLPINCYPDNMLNVESAVLRAMIYAFKNKKIYLESGGESGINISVLNMSLGMDDAFPEDAPTWCSLYDSLGSVGIWCYSAATNRNVDVGVNGDIPTLCPSKFLTTVNVSDLNDQHYSSGYSDSFVDLAAPGVDILTTVPESILPKSPYASESGTSYSTPMVAGVSILLESMACKSYLDLKQNNPDSAMSLWNQWLSSAVSKNADLENKTSFGGRLDAESWFNIVSEWCVEHDENYNSTNAMNKFISKPYPNPLGTEDILFFRSNYNGWYTWLNRLGQKVGEGQLLVGENKLSSPHKAGIYTLVCDSFGKRSHFNMIVLD